jgi:hypothetical protein
MSLRLSESLHGKLRELAKDEGISINQLAATALAEKVSALMTVDYLAARARRGNREDFARALARIPDVPPDERDML